MAPPELANPSEQLQLLLDCNKAYSTGDFAKFREMFTDDFVRKMQPDSLIFPGDPAGVEARKEKFLATMEMSRQRIFGDDFKIDITEVVEQPGRIVAFGVQSSSTLIDLPEPFNSEIVMLMESRREPSGQLKITRINNFVDSVKMNKFAGAVAAKMGQQTA